MMYVSANEKAVSLNLQRYTTGQPVKHYTQWGELAPQSQHQLQQLEKLIVAARVGLALFTTLFCRQNTIQLMSDEAASMVYVTTMTPPV
jgi:hypothetical protein